MSYLSISQKNERFASRPIYLSLQKTSASLFFCFPPPPPSHAFVGFLKDEKWHAGPDFTPVSGKNSREMALRWPRLGFSSHFLQPIYLSLQKTSASPLSLSIYLSKSRAPLKLGPYLREKKRNPAAARGPVKHVRGERPRGRCARGGRRKGLLAGSFAEGQAGR